MKQPSHGLICSPTVRGTAATVRQVWIPARSVSSLLFAGALAVREPRAETLQVGLFLRISTVESFFFDTLEWVLRAVLRARAASCRGPKDARGSSRRSSQSLQCKGPCPASGPIENENVSESSGRQRSLCSKVTAYLQGMLKCTLRLEHSTRVAWQRGRRRRRWRRWRRPGLLSSASSNFSHSHHEHSQCKTAISISLICKALMHILAKRFSN